MLMTVMVMMIMVMMRVTVMMMRVTVMMMLSSRSQGKEREAEALLKDSIRFGPHFADAYSSLASLYAEQVKHPDDTGSLRLAHILTQTEFLS